MCETPLSNPYYNQQVMLNYSDAELEEFLGSIESDLAERKSVFKGSVRGEARKAVCAFANDLPNHGRAGVLIIGAQDSGTPSNTPITDELLRSLSDMRTDGRILPMPTITVEKRVLLGAEMAVVTVMPSEMPPVRFEGRIWIRIGPRAAVASAQDERVLTEKRRHKNIPFDIHPVPAASLNDLSRLKFEEEYLPAAFAPDVLKDNERSYEERLASCKMILSPREPVPTVLGILSIGRQTRDYIPGASITFLRIEGTELSDDIVDNAMINGPIADQLRRIDDKLLSHNRESVDIPPQVTERRSQLYPQRALQQIISNAVLHRTYENTNAPVRVYWFNDRIEIISPGGPYGNVNIGNFGEPGVTDYRNPNLADVLRTYGLIQSFGVGLNIAREEMKRNGNPPLEFQRDSSFVRCILRHTR